MAALELLRGSSVPSRCGGNGAEEREPGVARRSMSSIPVGADERELQPGGGGGGRGGSSAGDEIRADARGQPLYRWSRGAQHTRRNWCLRGDLGAPWNRCPSRGACWSEFF
jgi:hypothetical protein